MQHTARWLLIAALSASLVHAPTAAQVSAEPPPETPAAEPSPPAPVVEPPPAPAAAAEPPPPSAAEPPARPDPMFDDWGAPGSDAVHVEPRIQAAIMLGVGASFDDTQGSVNPLGFGFGVRGSYRFLPHYPEFAAGGRFLYYVGGSGSLPSGEIAMSSWILAAEATYVFPIAGVLFEPGLALGLHGRAIEVHTPLVDVDSGVVPGASTHNEVGFYLAPGASVCIPLSLVSPDLHQFFVGADARLGMVFGHGVSGSFEAMAQGGVRFDL